MAESRKVLDVNSVFGLIFPKRWCGTSEIEIICKTKGVHKDGKARLRLQITSFHLKLDCLNLSLSNMMALIRLVRIEECNVLAFTIILAFKFINSS